MAKVVTVRTFGARLMGGQAAQEHATQVFLAQNRLWNQLVEIENEARESYRKALLDSDAELATLQAQGDSEQALIDQLIEARNKDRAAKRTKKSDAAPNYAQAIKDASARLKAVRGSMKEIKDRAKAAAKPLIEAAELARRAKVKAAVADCNLWWCHSETVLARFDVARVKAMKEGRTLRFHRFDGEGSMGVRFSVDGGSLAKIYGGSTSLLKIEAPTAADLGSHMKAEKSDGGVRRIITVRAGDKAEDKSIPTLRFLVTMHQGRDFPGDAPLKTVTLARTKHVSQFEWKIVFTFSREEGDNEPLPALPEKAAGVDFGFRLVRDGQGNKALRVATMQLGEKVRFVTLDEHWIRRMERADRIRGELDALSNDFQAWFRSAMTDEAVSALDADAWFTRLVGRVRRAKGAYASLLMDLCEAHAKADAVLGVEFAQRMQEYARHAHKLALQAHHIRRKAVDHRKHLYRNAAANLVREAGLIGLVDTDFRMIAATSNAQGEDNELALTARRHRTWAAPSELRLAIEQTATREKVDLVSVPATDNTRTCCACGHVHGKIEDLMFTCEGCGQVHDQDENAATNARNFVLRTVQTVAMTTT
ncbi:zinc ribbon domain-containing protein [Curvibacter sp. APW13]|uniref:zinc ribbon domain-containing protein n=1 Tax=Curvibacter sp. APW13 TaxID=3077236 RepID=UPI0028E0182F|nr:zinc ribbon domain-containing protein [Curvibacter sp. APW13]MDT8992694.1 zinc ribbon domain-containing protein [Curvibacter sp. APW13]